MNAVVAATVNAARVGADVAGEDVVDSTGDAVIGAPVIDVASASLFDFAGPLEVGAVTL